MQTVFRLCYILIYASVRKVDLLFCIVAVNTGTSLVLSSLLSVLVFAGMQMFSKQLGSTEWLTILGGFLGSVLFVCSLTVSFYITMIIQLIYALFKIAVLARKPILPCFLFKFLIKWKCFTLILSTGI